MRLMFAAMAVAAAFTCAGPARATQTATPAAVKAAPAASIIVAQRCRCVERRWNGSCKLRVCRDKW